MKKGLQQYLFDRSKDKVYIDLDNVIELNTFLPLMRKILIGDRKKKKDKDNPDLFTGEYEMIFDEEWKDQEVVVNNNSFIINKELLLFFYNAQYKGMLMDGGYFNNIPFNYLRDKFDDGILRDLLVIKLDGSYPPYFMDEINTLIEKAHLNEGNMRQRLQQEYLADVIGESEFQTILNERRDEVRDYNFEALVEKIQAKFDRYVKTWLDDSPKVEGIEKGDEVLSKNLQKKNRKHIVNIITEWYENYGKQNEIKPWAIPKPLIHIAFEGYAYGSKRGQIRSLSDHNFIVPLYDLGVDTYDFKMNEVAYLARASHVIAEKDIKAYFEGGAKIIAD